MSAIVRDENLLAIVDHDSVGEFQMLGTTKLGQNVAHLIKNDHAHHLGKIKRNLAFKQYS